VPVSDRAIADGRIQMPAARVIARPAGPAVIVTRSPDLSVPRIDVGLAKNQWDFTTITAGITVGALIGHLLAAEREVSRIAGTPAGSAERRSRGTILPSAGQLATLLVCCRVRQSVERK
jgi:hypothetical protein